MGSAENSGHPTPLNQTVDVEPVQDTGTFFCKPFVSGLVYIQSILSK